MGRKKEYSFEQAKRRVDQYINHITQNFHIVAVEAGLLRLLIYLIEKAFAAIVRVIWRTIAKFFWKCINFLIARFRATTPRDIKTQNAYEPEA